MSTKQLVYRIFAHSAHLAHIALAWYVCCMKDMARKNLHIPDEVVRLIGDVLHSARFRSETQAVVAMLEGASDRLKETSGYVYLMRGERGLKIGTSIQPHRRAKNLKSTLLHCIPGDRLTELAVHMLWGRYRLTASGEWFEDRKEIVDWFDRHEWRQDLEAVEDVGRKFVTLTLEPDLVQRLEAWIAKQTFPPAKNAVVEAALSEWLDRNEN